jgi:hypothetical protein
LSFVVRVVVKARLGDPGKKADKDPVIVTFHNERWIIRVERDYFWGLRLDTVATPRLIFLLPI